ncbi:MAG: capsid protein [Rhizobiaceae bacterium]
MKRGAGLVYTLPMAIRCIDFSRLAIASTPSARTLRAELLRLCARIGYSPPLST